jgi:hypothetical protein
MKKGAPPVVLFAITTIASLLLGLLYPLGAHTERTIISLGYFSLVLSTGIFLFSLRIFLPKFPDIRVANLKQTISPVAAILLTGLWIISIEPYALKIVIDEVLISSASQMMHLSRTPTIPVSASWSSGVFTPMDAFLDKRPFLLPFLTSILHDISGYRIGNVFALNTALLFGFLAISFSWISKILSRTSAYLFLVLMAFMPVLAQGATSGNASILNISLLTACIFTGYNYWRNPNKENLTPLVYGIILLAQVRYESVVYILPFGLLILWGWKTSRKVILPAAVVICPLFLVLNVIHIRYTLSASNFYWQDGPNGRDSTFSLSYFSENLQSAHDFLFSINSHYPNSPILTILGLTGLIVLLAMVLMKRLNTEQLVLLSLLSGLVIFNMVVVLFFNYGLFTTYATSRLSLPFQFFLGVIAVFAFRIAPKGLIAGSVLMFVVTCFIQTAGYEKFEWLAQGWFIGIVLCVILGAGYYFYHHINRIPRAFILGLLLLSLATMAPKMRAKPYYHRYNSAHDIAYFLDFISKNKNEDTLFVSIFQLLAILHNQSGLLPEDFILAAKANLDLLRTGHYQKIYILHRTFPDQRTASHILFDEYMKMLPEFRAELVEKHRTGPEIFVYVHELILKETSIEPPLEEPEVLDEISD